MEERLKDLSTKARAALEGATSLDELEEARARYLGRSGLLREIQQGIRDVAQELRPRVGQLSITTSADLERILEERRGALEDLKIHERGDEQRIVVTLPGRAQYSAGRHPLLATLDDMLEIFLGLGYSSASGPEVENYHYCFEALNYPS